MGEGTKTLVERLAMKAGDCEGEDRLDLREDARVMRDAISALEAHRACAEALRGFFAKRPGAYGTALMLGDEVELAHDLENLRAALKLLEESGK